MQVNAAKWGWFYRSCREILRAFLRLFGSLETRGLENFPVTGSAIIACNHVSYLDPPTVACAVKRRMRYMAKIELFKYQMTTWFLLRWGVFPVKRGEVDLDSIRLAIDILKRGEALVLFPEGTRSRDGSLGSAGAGIGMLAKRSGAMVVPTALIGTEKVLAPDAKHFSRAKRIVVFGKPLSYKDFAKDLPDHEARIMFGEAIMEEIRQLLEANGRPVPAKTEA